MTTFVYSAIGHRSTDAEAAGILLASALDFASREDWWAAYLVLQRALENPADKRAAHYMLWEVCQVLGHPEVAIANLDVALRDNPVTSRFSALPRRRVLVLAVPGDFQANLPLGALLEAADTELHTLWLTDPEAILRDPLATVERHLPLFDCVFISIAEDVRHRRALQAADRLARMLNVPIINDGSRISAISRTGAAKLLQDVPDAIVPYQSVVERTTLAGACDLQFPLIVRPSDSHAGKNLARIDSAEMLQTYLERVTSAFLCIAPFVDYRSSDGFWRKYRVIFVDGRPLPYHLAIHDDWAIWYYNARMDLAPWKRLEEATFTSDIGYTLPIKALRALSAIAACINLDYFGIDCGVLPDGRLVVFEIETGMIVHDWDPPDLYPYRHACVRSIRLAVELMIDSRVTSSTVTIKSAA